MKQCFLHQTFTVFCDENKIIETLNLFKKWPPIAEIFFSLQAWYLYKILRDLKIQTCYNGPCSMLKEMFGMLSQFGR